MGGNEPAQQVRLNSSREAEERRLINAAQRDRARFADLYESYFELVYAYVARRTQNRDAAEDLTAEVFRKALESLPRFKWTGAPFASWLFRIASNLIADRAKRAAREGKKAELLSADSPATRSFQQKDLEESEHWAHLFSLVEALSDDQRSVIVMRFAEEKSIRDIAGELGRSEGAIKQLQFRALQNLRGKLASDE
jgi:RNA polymerase sigma-70 factor (ECF subfamily)